MQETRYSSIKRSSCWCYLGPVWFGPLSRTRRQFPARCSFVLRDAGRVSKDESSLNTWILGLRKIGTLVMIWLVISANLQLLASALLFPPNKRILEELSGTNNHHVEIPGKAAWNLVPGLPDPDLSLKVRAASPSSHGAHGPGRNPVSVQRIHQHNGPSESRQDGRRACSSGSVSSVLEAGQSLGRTRSR